MIRAQQWLTWMKKDPAIMIELNEKYVLRPPALKDAEQLLAVKNNTIAAALLESDHEPFDLQGMQAWIKFHHKEEKNLVLLIEDAENKKVIGHVGLYDIDSIKKSATFGILIGLPEYWNKGIGKLATDKMIKLGRINYHLKEVNLHVLEKNSHAYHLYENLGFEQQTILENAVTKNGVPENIIKMKLEFDAE